MSPTPSTTIDAWDAETTAGGYNDTSTSPNVLATLAEPIIIVIFSLLVVAAVFLYRAALRPFGKGAIEQIRFWRWRSARRNLARRVEDDRREIRMLRLREKLAAAKRKNDEKGWKYDEGWRCTIAVPRQPLDAATGEVKQGISKTREVYRQQGGRGNSIPPPYGF